MEPPMIPRYSILLLLAGACGSSGGSGSTDSATSVKLVFITSATFDGDLATRGGQTSGLAGADALCANAGEAANLGRSFKAWVSDETTNAIDRIADVGPWHFATSDGSPGPIAFNNKANLGTIPLAALNITEQGMMLASSERAWTGSNNGGTTFVARTCTSWTSNQGPDFGIIGDAQSTSNWTYISAQQCNLTAHLYCIGQ